MSPETIRLVQQSWSQILPIASQAGALFYNNLFTLDPGLRVLFKDDIESQGARLMQMIDVAVSKLDNLEVLVPVLQSMGMRHAGYGVEAAHFQTVGAALLKTLEQGLGDAYTPEVQEAWRVVYQAMANVMIAAQADYIG